MKGKQSLFTSVNTNDGSKWTENVVNDEVYFPKFTKNEQRGGVKEKSRSNSLESLWISGFFHHEAIADEKKKSLQLKKMLCMPGSTMIPSVAYDILNKNDTMLSETQPDLHKPTHNYSKDLNANIDYHRITKEEDRALNEMATSFKKKKPSHSPKLSIESLKPYISTNAKVRNLKRNKKSTKRLKDMRSVLIDKYCLINRNEIEASIRIQASWRTHCAKKLRAELVLRELSAIIIQTRVRGVITRRRVRLWRLRTTICIVRCQAHFRRLLHIRRWKKQVALEHKCAITIQSCFRVYRSKCQLHTIKINKASIKIQAYCRRIIAQIKFSRMIHDGAATIIQTHIRAKLSRAYFLHLKASTVRSIIIIQSNWRKYLAKVILRDKLMAREFSRRENVIRLMMIDQSSLERLLGNHEKSLQGKEQLEKDLSIVSEALVEKEKELLEHIHNYGYLSNILEEITPRSVSEGWEDETLSNLNKERHSITDCKLDILFQHTLKKKSLESNLRTFIASRNDILRNIEAIKQWIDEEKDDLWKMKRDYYQRIENHRKRILIADEKRLWAVKHTTFSGKPKKRIIKNRNHSRSN